MLYRCIDPLHTGPLFINTFKEILCSNMWLLKKCLNCSNMWLLKNALFEYLVTLFKILYIWERTEVIRMQLLYVTNHYIHSAFFFITKLNNFHLLKLNSINITKVLSNKRKHCTNNALL